MDYSMLTGANGTPGSLSTWANNSRIAADLPEIVLEAESWVYRRLRHWRMLSPPLAGTMTVGSDAISFPSDLLEPSILAMTGSNSRVMPQVGIERIVGSWSYDGAGSRVQQTPTCYSFDSGAIRLNTLADQAYPYALVYYQQPAPLAVSGSNFLTQFYPRLLRVACMAACCEWLKDFGQGQADRTLYDVKAMDEIDKAQFESDRARRAQQSPAMIVGGGGGGSDGLLPAYGGF